MKLSARLLLGFLLGLSAAAAPPAGADLAGSVFDAGGRPIAGARVAAYAAEPSAARAERWLSAAPERAPAVGSSGPLVAVTDAAGRFALRGEPDSLLFVEAVAEGHVPNQAAVLPDDGEAVLILEEGVEVAGRVLGDGAPVAGATVVWTRREGHDVVARSDDAGRFRFTASRAGAVAGLLVFHPAFAPHREDRELAPGEPIVLGRGRQVAGRVADARGRPVAGAALAVDGLPAGASGEDGRFTLDHLPAEARRLRATAGDRVGEAAVAGGEVEVVVAPAGRIEGTVRLERHGTRRGLAGAAVTVHPLESDRFESDRMWTAPPQPLVVVAGAGGRYVAGGLPPGRYALQPLLGLERRVRQAEPVIRAAGAVEAHAVETHGVDSHLIDPHVVALRPGERAVRDLDLVLPPAVRGRVVDAAGRPGAGAAVAVVPEREAAAHLAFDLEGPRTDAAGRFEIPLLWIGGPQRLQVVVARRGHSPARSAPFALEAAADGPAGDLRVDVRLPPEAPLRVSVTGRGGTPLAGARVAFLLQEGGWGRMPPVEMLLDAPGAFVVTSPVGIADLHLAPGSYRLAAAIDGHQTLVRDLEVRGGGASTLELTLEPAVEIVGRVLRGGRPVPGVHIHLAVPSRFDEPLRTGADGVFRIPNLAPGEHRLVFVADEGSLHEERTVVAPSRDFVLELPPAGSLSLTVTGRDTGAPVEGVTVEVQPIVGDPAAPRRPRWHHGGRGGRGGDGERIEIAAVPAGEVEVLLGAAGYLPSGPLRVTVDADRTTELVVALDPGAELTGTVTGDGGRPLAGARVFTVPPGPGRVPQLRVAPPAAATGDDGFFHLRGLAAGPVVVHVQAEGYVPHQEELEIGAGRRLDVRLARGLTLSGTVTAGGEPLAGAQVGAATAALGGQHQSATSDQAGRFTLTGLLPVRYTVSAFRDGYSHRQIEGVDPRQARDLVLDLGPESTATIEGVLRGVPAPAGRVLHQAVSAQGEAGGAEAVVEPDGKFRIEGVPSGVVRVQAWVETEGGSLRSSPVAVEVAAGEVAWVELDLGAALTVSGRVTVEGEAVAGARLIFNDAEGTSATAVSGADGEYSIGLPRPGTYTVIVQHEPRVRAHYQAVHEIAGSRRLDVDVREAWLRGVVLDAESGEPVPEAFVTLLTSATGAGLQSPVAEAVTDRRGRFALAASTRGRFELLVGAAGYGQGRAEAAGVDDEVVVELRPAAGLRVRVVEAGGDVPLQAHLVVRDESGLALPTRTRMVADGSQQLSLAPGGYLVTSIVQGYGQRTVAATAPGELTIEVGPAGTLVVETAPGLAGRLHLVDATGVEAQPCCQPPGWPLTGEVTSVAGLAAGRYMVELRDAGGEVVASAPVLLEAGGSARLRFE